MLGRWFKKKVQLDDPDAAVRRQAIDNLDVTSADTQAILTTLARNDDDATVRQAAIARIADATSLESLLKQNQLTSIVAQRMAELVVSDAKWSWLAHEPVFTAYLPTMNLADREQVAPYLNSPQRVAEFLLALPHGQAESCLDHPLLKDDAGLQVLEHRSRGRSKSLNRFARKQLDAHKTAQASFAELKARCAQIDTAINRDPDDLAKLRKLLPMREALVEQAQQLADSAVVAGDNFALPAAPLDMATLNAREQAAEQQALEQAQQAKRALAAHSATSAEDESTAIEVQQEAQHDVRLKAAFWSNYKSMPQDSEQQSIAKQLATRQQRLKELRQALQDLDWPTDQTEPPVVNQAHTEIARLNAELAGLRDTIATAESELAQQLTAIQTAIDAGQTKDVGRALQTARTLLQSIPATQSSAKEGSHKLTQLGAQLNEMRDWQKFATDPKRLTLLDELEQLCTQPLAPPAQAEELKALRRQWQQLGRPTSSGQHEQQQRFDALAEQAFAPCKEYFDALQKEREENLRQRMALTEQLKQYIEETDWVGADFKAAHTIMRTARDEWRRFHPCDRKSLRPIEQEFEALQDQLYGRLKQHWEKNAEAKRTIIAEAAELLDNQDSTQQVEAVKRLQQRWQKVGTTPRSVDQRLWKEFRTACDAVFAQREASHQAFKTEQQEVDRALSSAIDNLEQAALRAGQQLDASHKEYDALNQVIDDLREQQTQRRTDKQLNTAREMYQAALQRVANQSAIVEVNRLKEWDIEVSAKEQAGESVSERHTEIDAHQDCLRLTLEAELAAELPSAAEDQEARMALQIEFMNQGVRNLDQRDYKELLQRWNKIGPKGTSEDPLRERFFAAIHHRLDT